MTRPVAFTAELRQWWRAGTGHEDTIHGYVWNDRTGVYYDGEPKIISMRHHMSSIAELDDYYIIRTAGYTFKAMKSEEIKHENQGLGS